MSEVIVVENQGPLVAGTNYFESELAAAGYYYLSPNSGALRLLVPPSRSGDLAEIRTAREVVVRCGMHAQHGREMFELLFDDRSPSPFVLYLSPEQWERLPAASDYGLGFEFTAWESRRGEPHKVLSRPCWLAEAPLPCLQPFRR